MAPKITRRTFVLSVIASAMSLVVGGCATRDGTTAAPTTAGDADPLAATAPEQVNLEETGIAPIVDLLHKQFDYLDLDAAGLVAFAQDFQAKAGEEVLSQQANNPEEFLYSVSTQFLMSSDFFWNGADESRPVKYVAYYDVYNACTSPFARFD